VNFFEGAVAIDRQGNALVEHEAYLQVDRTYVAWGPRELLKIDPLGGDAWFVRKDNWTKRPSCGLAVTSQDRIIALHTVVPGATDDDGNVLDIQGEADLLVTERDPTGGLAASLQLGDSREEQCWGLVADVQDAFWIGYHAWSERGSAIHVRRIAP
jgi:hypothetical protein